MASRAYISFDGELAVPNHIPYENISDYNARISHLNPDLIPHNSPILSDSTNSEPVEASYFTTDSTSLISSDGVHRRGRRRGHHDTLGLVGEEWKLLDYLPQMSKKPRLKSHTSSAHNQYFIQQPLQGQGPLPFQNFNQQMKTLLQQHNLHIMKEKNRLIQSIPQYMGGLTQQQMSLYLQQRAKCSVPGTIPFRSGLCSRRLLQFLYHLQQRPSDNSIKYWRKFVAEYYAVRGKKRWCLSLYKDVGERALGVFSQEAWHCDMCGSKSGKGFEANFELLPRLYKIYFDSGVIDELLFLDLPHEYVLPSGLVVLRYEKVVQQTIYEHFRVVREGQLRIVFRNDLKILAWEFCAHMHDEVVPRSLVAPQVNELVQAAEKCQRKGGSSVVAVKKLQSTCKKFVATEGQLMKNLDSILVNDLGFPKTYVRCLQTAEIMSSMKDLMSFSRDNNVGPIESLKIYSREGTIGNNKKKHDEIPVSSETVVTGSKQTAYGEMNCHQKTQSCCLNSEKQKLDSVNYPTANAGFTPIPDPKPSPIPDPKPSIQSVIKQSPVSCSSSSTFSNLDDKIQEQMIDKILQQMESNTRDQADMSKIVKVKEEIFENSDGGSTNNVVIKNIGKGVIGKTKTAVWKSVPENRSKKRENIKSAVGNIHVKEEPDDDIYKGLYLPEAIKDLDRGFFCTGGLNDEWNEIGWNGKH